MQRLFHQLFGGERTEGTADNANRILSSPTQTQNHNQPIEAEIVRDEDRTYSLRTQSQNVSRMSGVQFEHYMAEVFELLGYKVKVLGGAGDQGVDLLLRKDNGLIAVQCKNCSQPVGNKPVQEVFAGAKHHGVRQAWVVAPGGFTRGAWDLAQSTQVTLFDHKDIENWLKQATSHQRVSRLQREVDREHYQTLLGLFARTLDNLERRCDKEHRILSERVFGAEAKKRYQQMHHARLYKYIGGYLRDLYTLEDRHPEFTTGDFTVSRAALEERQRKVQQRAEELEISTEGPASAFGESEGGTLPESASTIASSSPNHLALGDAASIADRGWLIVHSYESPVPPPRYKQPEPGHEFSAIEVEGYAGQNPNDYLDHLQQSDFKLQMPDSTRLRVAFGAVAKEPALLNNPLTPGDHVRGWITFQTPQGEKPKCVVYSRKRTVLKWSILED